MGEWWNKEGKPLHADLLDPENAEWIANIPRSAVVKIAKWWSIAEAFENERLEAFIKRLMRISASVDGFRSEEVTRTIEGLRRQEEGHLDSLQPRYQAREREREQPRI